MQGQGIENPSDDLLTNLGCPFNGMRPVDQNFRLYDGDYAKRLADGGVTGQSFSIRRYGKFGGQGIGDVKYAAPFRKPCPKRFRCGKPDFKAVEAEGDLFIRGVGQRAFAFIDLDAGHNALAGQQFRHGKIVEILLFKGFLEQDHATDMLMQPGRRENDASILLTHGFSGLNPNGLEALGNRWVALVCRKHALTGLNQIANRGLQVFLNCHAELLFQMVSADSNNKTVPR